MKTVSRTLAVLALLIAPYATLPAFAGSVDGLMAKAAAVKALTDEVIKLEDAKARILGERMQPIAAEIDKSLKEAISTANRLAEMRRV